MQTPGYLFHMSSLSALTGLASVHLPPSRWVSALSPQVLAHNRCSAPDRRSLTAVRAKPWGRILEGPGLSCGPGGGYSTQEVLSLMRHVEGGPCPTSVLGQNCLGTRQSQPRPELPPSWPQHTAGTHLWTPRRTGLESPETELRPRLRTSRRGTCRLHPQGLVGTQSALGVTPGRGHLSFARAPSPRRGQVKVTSKAPSRCQSKKPCVYCTCT